MTPHTVGIEPTSTSGLEGRSSNLIGRQVLIHTSMVFAQMRPDGDRTQCGELQLAVRGKLIDVSAEFRD